jgi:hypothetical protein
MKLWVRGMPIKYRNAKKSLRDKGFKDENRRDHDYFFFYYQGKKTNAFTYFSRSPGSEIDVSLLPKMMRELHLDKSRQVHDLLSCPLDSEQYTEILKEKNVIVPSDDQN